MNTFLLTPGEFHGIGLEVCLKSIEYMQSFKDRFIVWTLDKYLEEHSANFKTYSSLNDIPHSSGVYFLNSTLTPVEWFKESVELCTKNENFGIVTGPLEKKSFGRSEELGHTEYLRSRFKDEKLFMTFFGDIYSCLLLTDHCPLHQVSNLLSKELLTKGIQTCLDTATKLKLDKPVSLLGLNPHAGENGLLGSIETDLHKPISSDFNNVIGPLSPDGFFSISDYQKFSFLVANYHDQGLIPFKVINGFNAAQASLGLPFVRTSVDHGTAANLYGKNQANPQSMMKAIKLAQELI